MSEPKSFLERWSRRKADAQREASPTPDAPTAPVPQPVSTENPKARALEPTSRSAESAASASAAPKPEFDLASLPPLDTITAATDIRGFLAPGVPPELSRAALRRAWQADPAVRDFVGLQENDWDFTSPAGVPGFGDLPPGHDIKKMIARVFGDGERKPEQATAPLAHDEQVTAMPTELASAEVPIDPTRNSEAGAEAQPANTLGPTSAQDSARQIDVVHRNRDFASQQENAGASSGTTKPRRRHGGALPEL
jgi:hypothetical protein